MSKKPENVCCQNCVFFEAKPKDPGDGWCNRYPPVVEPYPLLSALHSIHWAVSENMDKDLRSEESKEIHPDNHGYDIRPRLLGTEWCGEFKADWPA